MSRIIQMRRGSADENSRFIGADGEITVDTTNKSLRVHDGETMGGTLLARADIMNGGDWVIESQMPTAENNYTWYRKYKSGWVEMGSEINNAATHTDITVPLPVVMADNHYTLIRTQIANNTQSYYPAWVAGYNSKTTTDFTFTLVSGLNVWYACGMAK